MLAINGGEKTRTEPFPAQETIGQEEINAVNRVMQTGKLSHYRGNSSKYFYGGPEIANLEKSICEKFNVAYAIPTNSCTSALHIACGAINLQPGDEVIVTPWSMTCSATAPLIYGAIPVFADIEHDYFCLDPKSIEEKITDKTRAIIVVDLFGQPCDVEAIRKIADKYHLFVIEDAAQAIGSKYKDEYAGTFFDIGCYSFTQGKHLTAGEGGMIVTNKSELAHRCRLIMNHAEAVVNEYPQVPEGHVHFSELVGFNMRMTEIQAAIIVEQLKKLDRFIEMRQKNVKELNSIIYGIGSVPQIRPVLVREHCTHSYYVQGFHTSENKRITAVNAELTGEAGRPDRPMLGKGYITPLYKMPLFQQKTHWAWKDVPGYPYYMEHLPIVELLHNEEFFLSMYHNLPLTHKDCDDIVQAFMKAYDYREEL